MARLGALLRQPSGAAEVELHFRLSASGVPRVDGSVVLQAALTCQRCLDPVRITVRPALRRSFTEGEGALGRAELAAGYEPLEREGPVELSTLVEDELLLALPDFPMHPPEVCASAAGADRRGDLPDLSPFAGLRALRARPGPS